MRHHKAFLALPFSFLLFISFALPLYVKGLSNEDVTADVGPVMGREKRRTLFVNEYGEISAIDIRHGPRPPYHLRFFTLEPNSLFLPVILHEDTVLYVETGSGRLISADEDGIERKNIRQGDIVSLTAGSIFYLQSSKETERTQLRMCAIFGTEDNSYDPSVGAYSSISELVRGFGKKIMQAAYQAPEEIIEAITNRTESPSIVHAISNNKTAFLELEEWFLNEVGGTEGGLPTNIKKIKTYNIFEKDPDFKSCNGWSSTVTKKELRSLKSSNIGFCMVNVTAGSMTGPHWNTMATEVSVVLEGAAMVRVVCGGSSMDKQKCQNMRFKVTQGDVFLVPKFLPVAQMSYNNGSLVFIGFSKSAKKNYTRYLTGKISIFRSLNKDILAASLNVTNTTIKHLLASKANSIIASCVSCAEEEERKMNEEIEKKEEEETKKREEEKRKEEEEEREREEEEKSRKREEEKKREDEEDARRKQKEEARETEREKGWEEEGGDRGQEWGGEERWERVTDGRGEEPRNENSLLQGRRVLKIGRF